jgi:hypothetical protein
VPISSATGRQALDQQVGEKHPQYQASAVLGGDENLTADLEQDPCQQRRRQGCRDALDQAFETSGEPANRHQHGAGDVGADGFAVTHAGEAGNQQRRARGRPGNGDGGAVTQRQADAADGHADRNGPDPRRNLTVGQPGGLASLEHQHQRTGVAGHHGNETGNDGGR